MRLFTLKLLLVSLVACAVMLAGATGVFANAGDQNPDLVVSINLSPPDPVVGDSITVNGSVSNTTDSWQTVRVCFWRKVNDNDPVRDCDVITMAPLRVRSFSRTWAADRAVAGTTISVRLAATNANGTSWAQDSVTFS
jgi:hypothetical protein